MWHFQVEVLLQTNKLGNMPRRGEPRKRNAIFEVALLDGHMEFVSHERFQQQLHFIWGKASFFLEWQLHIFWLFDSQICKAR